jgi:histone deacetylase complex regulatory component SIN3
MKKSLKTVVSLVFLLIVFVLPQAVMGLTQQDDTTAKQDLKDAGRSTKHAAKKTASATKKGSKKAAHKTAKKTKEGAEKVEDKTQP